MKRVQILKWLLPVLFLYTIGSFSQIEKILEEGLDSGSNCSIEVVHNSQVVTTVQVNQPPTILTFTINLSNCINEIKLQTNDSWLTLSKTSFVSSGALTVSISGNNTPTTRTGFITFLQDDGSGNSILLKGVTIQQAGNPSLSAYYKDTDQDGFGDHDGKVIYSETDLTAQPQIITLPDGSISEVYYVTNNLDQCPNEFSLKNNGCEDSFEDKTRNWVKSKSYDIKGKLIGAGKVYYDDLGKQEQSQSYETKEKRTWATQTKYDAQGRPILQTLSAPITAKENGLGFGFKSDFIKKTDGTVLTSSDVESSSVINTPKIQNATNTLGGYYVNNTSEPLQDKTERPYSRTVYSSLMPGAVKQIVGGNKHDTNGNGTIDDANDTWKQGYNFSMPAAQEMYYVFGYNTFKSNPSESSTYENISNILGNTNNHIVWLKAGKTVVQDDRGNESVVFTDVDGKTLGTARSGGDKEYEVLSLIGEQRYVDIHIPIGCEGTASLLGSVSDYKIYNLKTEVDNGNISEPGFYRIEYIGTTNLTKSHTLTYIDKTVGTTTGKIKPVMPDAVGIRYKVNYYDFSLNYYNEIGQLTSSLQPLGFNANCLDNLSATVTHNDALKSTFTYDVLGQLVSTTSPDEGTANFKYRKDGQIRFSQNSKQKDPNEDGNFSDQEFSYTNYDELGRPVESGVAVGTFTSLDADVLNFTSSVKREQQFTQYDFLTSSQKVLLNAHPRGDYKRPTFLSGNVAYTYNTDNIGITISESYYSYDVHGRVKWIVQKSKGLTTAKTIDYVYDPVTSQVTKVYFEKDNTAEQFIHKYTYDPDTQQLVKVETSTDDVNFIEHAGYNYYETGALKRTTIAGGIQDIDYVYNLAGQLKAINHPDLVNDPEINPNGNDLFGMVLDYHTGDYTRNDKFKVPTLGTVDQYNGNIKAFTWNSKSNSEDTSTALQYKYSYDRNNWLTTATFDGNGGLQIGTSENLYLNLPILSSQDKLATNSITLEDGFSVKASSSLTFTAKIGGSTTGSAYGVDDYNVSNITYDANGNILSLHRNKNTESGSNKMDELTYEYKEGTSNKLDRVIDAQGSVGVQDIDTQNAGNYVYNNIGQLIEDHEYVTTTEPNNIVRYIYNASGLVTEVTKNDVSLVKFFYNDKGFRIQKLSYNTDGSINRTTNYLRDASGTVLAIYDDNTQIELPIYGASRLGIYNKVSSTNVYQLTDHLGNVRAVIAKSGDKAIAMSKTDYYPFGMPMPNRQIVNGEPYRYAYQGQEKDSETGKEAFQLRLWDARIGRWMTTDPYGQYDSPYNGMGNDPVNGIDPDGGYRSLFMAFAAWAGRGFKGKLHRAGLGGNKEWAIRTVESNLNYEYSGGDLFTIKSYYGNDLGPGLMVTQGQSLMTIGAKMEDLPEPYVDVYAKSTLGAQIGLKTPFGKAEGGIVTFEMGRIGFSTVDGFYAKPGDGTSHNFLGAKAKFLNDKLAIGGGVDYVTPTAPPEGADLLEFYSSEENKLHWSLYAGPGKSYGPGLPHGLDGGKLSGKYESNGRYIKFNGGLKFILGIDVGVKVGFK